MPNQDTVERGGTLWAKNETGVSEPVGGENEAETLEGAR